MLVSSEQNGNISLNIRFYITFDKTFPFIV